MDATARDRPGFATWQPSQAAASPLCGSGRATPALGPLGEDRVDDSGAPRCAHHLRRRGSLAEQPGQLIFPSNRTVLAHVLRNCLEVGARREDLGTWDEHVGVANALRAHGNRAHCDARDEAPTTMGTKLRTAVAKAFRECEAAMPGCGA